MAFRAPKPSNLVNVRPVYGLDLVWAGATYRVATAPLDLTRADGSVVFYNDAMSDIDFIFETERQGIQIGNSVPIALYLDGVDVAREVARGHRLEAATGSLFMVLVDRDTGVSKQTYLERFSLISGRLSRPVYADPSRAAGYLSFTLDDSPSDDSRTLIDEEFVVNPTTWATAPDSSVGKVYPIIIGAPGDYQKADGTVARTAGSPAYPLHPASGNVTKLLIAGHEVEATTVVVTGDGAAGGTFNVSQELDGRGNIVSTVDISTPGSLDPTSAQYWVTWHSGGGLPNQNGSGLLEGLGDVCAWALQQTTMPVDIEKWIAEGGLLNRIKIATYINQESLTPWSFVVRLLDELMIEVRSGPLGLYPFGRVLSQSMANSVTIINEDADFEPIGAVTTETRVSEVINKVSIKYALRGRTGDYKRSITVSPERYAVEDDTEFYFSEFAVISANRWSTNPARPLIQSETLSLPHIYDDSSAALIALERVRALGLGYSSREYVADVRFGWLMIGDRFQLVSPSLHRTFLVTVLSKAWDGSSWIFSLALDEDPVRISSLKDY